MTYNSFPMSRLLVIEDSPESAREARKAFPTATIVESIWLARTALLTRDFDFIISTTHLVSPPRAKDIVHPILSIAWTNLLPMAFVGSLTLIGRFKPSDASASFVRIRALSVKDVALSLQILSTNNRESNFQRLEWTGTRTTSVARKNFIHWKDALELLRDPKIMRRPTPCLRIRKPRPTSRLLKVASR